jgi:hypothetical protein
LIQRLILQLMIQSLHLQDLTDGLLKSTIKAGKYGESNFASGQSTVRQDLLS